MATAVNPATGGKRGREKAYVLDLSKNHEGIEVSTKPISDTAFGGATVQVDAPVLNFGDNWIKGIATLFVSGSVGAGADKKTINAKQAFQRFVSDRLNTHIQAEARRDLAEKCLGVLDSVATYVAQKLSVSKMEESGLSVDDAVKAAETVFVKRGILKSALSDEDKAKIVKALEDYDI
jgi:hypothetical protein